MQLAWGQHVSEDFRNRVLEICSHFGWQQSQASDLMACMAWETGETFSPSICNGAGSGAIGLIQFMPSTAQALGTSTDELKSLSATEQLDYVEKYFRPYASRIKTLADMYMAILYPAYISSASTKVIFANGTIAYKQNRGFDINNDGEITKEEVTSKVQQKLDKGLRQENAFSL